MRRRTFWIVFPVLLLAAAIVAAFLLRRRAAPEPARLLPAADGYLYVDLKPLRLLGVIGKNPPAIQEPDYAEFVRATGFQFERDLDEAAFAIHVPPRPIDAEPAPGASRPLPRYSEVFRGHFDSQRATDYFRKIARSPETYREVEIYSIPLEGRTVRVALLGVGVAAVSNTDGPRAVHFMIDRYKEVALPFGGPPLIREYYRRVPLGSLVWGMAHLSNEQGRGTPLVLPGGYDLLFPTDTVLVASVRYTTAIQFKAEAFTANPDLAKQLVDQVGAFLAIFRGLEKSMNPSGTDPDVKAFFASLQIEQYKNRAELSASVPPGFLKKAFAETPVEAIAGGMPEASPTPTPKPRRHKR
jgi:hypothetical protein